MMMLFCILLSYFVFYLCRARHYVNKRVVVDGTDVNNGSCYRQRNGRMIDECELTTDMAMLRYRPGTSPTRSLSLLEPMRST